MSLEEVKKNYSGWTRYGVSHRSRRNTIGIEIEYDGRSSYEVAGETNREIREILNTYGIEHEIEGDASLQNGYEVVISPITLDHLKLFSGPAFIQVFDLLRKNGWNNSTGQAGGHMSVGRRSFGRSTDEQNERLYRLHKFCYRNRDELQAFARRPESRYAQWYNAETLWSVSDDFGQTTAPQLKQWAVGKFQAIEYKDATIQFRFFGAHLAFDQLLARFELIQLLVQTFNGDLPANITDETTLGDIITAARRSKPNAYREYIATLDR